MVYEGPSIDPPLGREMQGSQTADVYFSIPTLWWKFFEGNWVARSLRPVAAILVRWRIKGTIIVQITPQSWGNLWRFQLLVWTCRLPRYIFCQWTLSTQINIYIYICFFVWTGSIDENYIYLYYIFIIIFIYYMSGYSEINFFLSLFCSRSKNMLTSQACGLKKKYTYISNILNIYIY